MINYKSNYLPFLFITLIIVFIVSLIILFTFPQQLAKSRDKQRKKDIELIRTSLYDYFLDFNCYPKSIPDCHNFDIYPNKEYFSRYSCDPKGLNYVYEPEKSDCPSYFEIFVNLENTADNDINISNCTNGCGPGCFYNFSLSSTNYSAFQSCPPKN